MILSTDFKPLMMLQLTAVFCIINSTTVVLKSTIMLSKFWEWKLVYTV